MKIGIGLPFKMPTDSWDYISTVARKADEGPFSSFSALDRLAYDNFEAMIELAAVAAITKRIRLVTAILLAPVRNAGVLAKEAATIDAHPRAMARVGKFANGYVMGGRALEEEWAKDVIDQVKKSWADADRSGEPRIIVTLPCALGEGAEDAVANALGDYYGGAGTAGATRQGRAQPTSKSIIRDAISMHESLGTDEIILRPVTANPEQIDRLADAIS